MQSVGQQLRQARLNLGLTLDAVSSSTRINIKTLSAIESDQLNQISSPFLYKSFVRQTGKLLGLDVTALEQNLLTAVERMPEPLVPGQGGAPLPPVAAPPRPRKRLSRWVYSLASLGSTLAVCSALYGMYERSRSESPTQIISQWTSSLRAGWAHNNLPSRASSMPVSEQKTPVPSATLAPAIAAPVAATGSSPGTFHIELSAIEQSWLSLSADGKEVYNGVLRRAETKRLEGHQDARIQTGNAGGVEVVFNGRNLGPLGSHGQLRTVLFNRNGYEVLQPRAFLQISPVSLLDDLR